MVEKPCGKRCIIAVGSTYFDELIQALDTAEFATALVNAGFGNVLFQIGKYESIF